MAHDHIFIFQPGIWIGEGKVTFSASPDHMHFYTKWEVQGPPNPDVTIKQTVEMQGASDNVLNHFTIYEISSDKFNVDLSNDIVGSVSGKGVIDPRSIAWEFRGHKNFEGFEVFELQKNGDYMLHAEYSSTEQFRTIIDGRIWKKET